MDQVVGQALATFRRIEERLGAPNRPVAVPAASLALGA
jgi:hypothetical protein